MANFISLSLDLRYDEIFSFFQEIWKSDYDYIVTVSPSCYQLNNLCVMDAKKRKAKVYNADKIISAEAMLMNARYFAEEYIKHEKFPTLLLIDNILFHGRDAVRFYVRFRELISASYKQMKNVTELDLSDEYYLDRHLSDATTLMYYCEGKSRTWVDGLYSLHPEATTTVYPAERFEALNRINLALHSSEEPLVSFQFALKVPRICEKSNSKTWAEVPWQYSGCHKRFYFSQENKANNLLSFVYIHNYHYVPNLSCVTGCTLFGDVPKTAFRTICNNLAKELRTFKLLSQILSVENNLLATLQAQLLSFILSVISVWDFCKSFGISIDKDQIATSSNLSIIANNFGPYKDILPEMLKLCQSDALVNKIKSILYKQLTDNAAMLYSNTSKSSVKNVDMCSVNHMAEDILFDARMVSETEAFKAAERKITFRPLKKNSSLLPISQFISKLAVPVEQSLACLTTLMYFGYANINFDSSSELDVVQCSANTTTFSLLIVARRFHWSLAALGWLEQEHYSFRDLSQQDLVKEFISHLPLTPLAGNNGCSANADEAKALQELKNVGCELVDKLYSIDVIFGDYEQIQPTFWDYLGEEGIGNYNWNNHSNYMKRSWVRPLDYLEYAQKFIEEKRPLF